jgi:phage I-like protein
MDARQQTSRTNRHEALALNAEGGGTRVAALCFELPASVSEAPPKTITLIPAAGADGFVRGEDGRKWRMGDVSKIVAAFTRPRAITENHAGYLAAREGRPSPAHGWIDRIRAEGGAIVGDVTWTSRGQAALSAREYRYFSPEFVHDEKSGEILEVVGGSVTNDPNFPQLALNAQSHSEQHMNLTAICVALGLAPNSDETAVLTAINSLKVERQTALNAAQAPDPAKFAPRAELEVALNRATTAEGEIKSIKKSSADAEIVAFIDGLQAKGQVIPATRDYYLALCRQEGGFDQVKKLATVLPVIAAPTTTNKKVEEGTGAEGLTPNQLAICAQSGIAPKAYAESLKASAVAAV